MEELTFQKQNIAISLCEPCNAVEQPIDCDITLPDYLKDIQKILKCVAIPGVASVSTSGNRITAEGSVTVRIVYLDETNCISTYEQGIPFAKHVEVSDLSGAVFVDCAAKTGYMNCRAVNQRRIDIHGAVSLKFTTRMRQEVAVVTDRVSSDIEKRSQQMRIANPVADVGRYFAISEVETIKERPPVSSIVKTSAYALVNEVKVIKDKALIKGDLLISISYTTGTSAALEFYDTRMPISQIVDAPGLDENEIIDTFLRVTQVNVIPKADGTGEYKLLDISVKMLAEMHAYKECEFSAITDAYSTGRELALEVCEVPVLKFAERISESVVVTNSLDLPGAECTEVIDMWCSDLTSNYGFKDGTLEIYGSATLGVLAGETGDNCSFYEKTIDFSYTRDFSEAIDLSLTPCVTLTAQSTLKNADGGIDVKLEFSISANIFIKEYVSLVTDIAESEGKECKCDDGAALIIYFALSGESVWDIARHYNTTVSAIMSENDITDEVLPCDTMLLIPR